MGGGFPIDLLLFGMIAAFLVLRLRGILGRKTGFERPAQPESAPSVVPGLGRPGGGPGGGRQAPPPAPNLF